MKANTFHTKMAMGYFKPIYPVIAENILKKCPRKRGICVDIGCGSGVLGLEIAKISRFDIINIDPDEEFVRLALAYAGEQQMSHRVIVKKGWAEQIPLGSNSVDLVVSRGSVYFWDDKVKGLQEIYRVLKPGGFAYIGGGMGSASLGKSIHLELQHDKKWNMHKNTRFRNNLPIHHKQWMRQTGIENWSMESSQEGTWILITK